MSDVPTIVLPPKLAGPALPVLLRRLMDVEGPMRLDASKVTRVGTDGVQLLISARKRCDMRGAAFAVVDRSEAFARHIEDLALTSFFAETVQ